MGRGGVEWGGEEGGDLSTPHIITSYGLDTLGGHPAKYIFDVTSIGQRSSPGPSRNSGKVEINLHLGFKLRSSPMHIMLWKMH